MRPALVENTKYFPAGKGGHIREGVIVPNVFKAVLFLTAIEKQKTATNEG